MSSFNLAKDKILAVGAKELKTVAFSIHSFSERPEWYAFASDQLLIHPCDRLTRADGAWQINPEYQQQELDQLGATLRVRG
jgi:hypothetical protein